MKIYLEVELPETCYITEAAEWISLGRVPTAEWDLEKVDGIDVLVESRRSAELTWEGSAFIFRDFVSAAEFRALDLEVDYPRYERAAAGTGMRSGAEILDVHLAIERRLESRVPIRLDDEDYQEIRKENQREVEREAKEADWAREHDAPFQPLLDLGKSKIFEALCTGAIPAEGWLFYEDDEGSLEDIKRPPGRFVDIPQGHWTLRGIDWDECKLRWRGLEYHCVQLRSANLLEKFPVPMLRAREISGTAYGGTFIASGDAPTFGTARRRGRPTKGDGLLPRALQAEFRRRAADGRLSSKKEATLQEAIEWAHTELGEKISRTAAQRYLAPIFEAAPKNDAR